MNVFGTKDYKLPTAHELEEGIREKVHALPVRTPDTPPPSLDNVSDLVDRATTALTERHQELLDEAKACFLQVESCLASAQHAREQMLAARKGALCEKPAEEKSPEE